MHYNAHVCHYNQQDPNADKSHVDRILQEKVEEKEKVAWHL